MGKSTAADMLRVMGVPVHDSDAVARHVIGPGGAAVDAVARHFPAAHDRKAGSIDRQVLGAAVFADREQKKTLESIVHPHVWASQQDFIRTERNAGRRVVVMDIPLLYEAGAESRVDKVIVVTCPTFIQKHRVMQRPGMTADKFNAILAAQIPDREKRCRADFVVQTGLGRAFTFRALKKIIQTVMNEYNHDQKRNNLPPFHPR